MSDNGNILGGKGAGLYVPLTEIEQEAIARLIERDDLQILIHGWGVVNKPKIAHGDLRLTVDFRVSFTKPAMPVPVWFFDLELQTRAGAQLYKERMPVVYGSKPLTAQAGLFYDLRWHIALKSIDPKLVKAILPGVTGLTSRRQDRDTGLMTETGNMKLNSEQRAAMQQLQAGEKEMRQDDLKKAVRATREAGYDVKVSKDGVQAPDVE